ncbi:MAG: hypothetical protein R3F19_23985 [Verrucomicrobiales bacterium]
MKPHVAIAPSDGDERIGDKAGIANETIWLRLSFATAGLRFVSVACWGAYGLLRQ